MFDHIGLPKNLQKILDTIEHATPKELKKFNQFAKNFPTSILNIEKSLNSVFSPETRDFLKKLEFIETKSKLNKLASYLSINEQKRIKNEIEEATIKLKQEIEKVPVEIIKKSKETYEYRKLEKSFEDNEASSNEFEKIIFQYQIALYLFKIIYSIISSEPLIHNEVSGSQNQQIQAINSEISNNNNYISPNISIGNNSNVIINITSKE
ncbi:MULTISPECIES: hypothetical protein [Rodentibacter]|uniref:hypothetical protein n=1 Tax=Rodentibacter TaxID=1960084 RepID=UPI001CFE8DBD|nr:hypothetical protein [Rodentibacter sp. JRC1]GJI55885.1 hypothetical protein HEMROJRC1_09970 [Rodentibacter sp. JRC1]